MARRSSDFAKCGKLNFSKYPDTTRIELSKTIMALLVHSSQYFHSTTFYSTITEYTCDHEVLKELKSTNTLFNTGLDDRTLNSPLNPIPCKIREKQNVVIPTSILVCKSSRLEKLAFKSI